MNCQSCRQDLSHLLIYVPQKSPEGKDFRTLTFPFAGKAPLELLNMFTHIETDK